MRPLHNRAIANLTRFHYYKSKHEQGRLAARWGYMKSQTVIINGTVYDKRTGMPLRAERGTHETEVHDARAVHAQPQHATTLNRKYVTKQPASSVTRQQNLIVGHRKAPTVRPDITRSASVARFERNQAAVAAMPKGRAINDFAPVAHPITQRVNQRTAPAKTVRVVKPSDVIKQESIAKATASMPKKSAKQHKEKRERSRMARAMSVASAACAVLILGGYVTYLNMPSLSTRVAATQAGINATYPQYQPSGYSLSGPVAYDTGTVSMKFAANAGPQSYTITQKKSGWDSAAVLDSYVSDRAKDSYTTSKLNGLTVYTFGTNAAWVNGGILYTITGDAPLSSEQVQSIVASL